MASLSLSVFCAKDHRFAHTRGAVDARMKTLTKESVGTDTKQASAAIVIGTREEATTAGCLASETEMNTDL
jgi:hypothetical protein